MFKLSPLPRTLEAALCDTDSDKFEVRLSAVRDLGRLATGADRGAVLARLSTLLENDGAPGIRAEAALALAEASAGECLDALLAALDDAHERVRQMALVALGEVAQRDDPRVVEAVRTAFASAHAPIRYQALVALHHLTLTPVDDALNDALADDDAQIRYIALRIVEERWVGAQGDRELVAVSLPSPLLAAAHRLSEDSVPEVRLAAAILLARARIEGLRAPLVDAVNGRIGVREPEDEQAAVELAGDLRLAAARSGLERRAFGWRFGRDAFHWQARVALAKMGDARAIAAILRGLEARSRDARTLAVAAVGAAGLTEALEKLEAMRGDDRLVDQNAVTQALANLARLADESGASPGTASGQPGVAKGSA